MIPHHEIPGGYLTSTDIIPWAFDDRLVRSVLLEDEPWFVANDVCAILELRNPRSSLALLDDDEKGVHSVDTPGGQQKVTIVSESGLFALIFHSRKAEARAFRRWVTREVLPSIRRTGGYDWGLPYRPAPPGPEEALVGLRALAARGGRW